MILLSIPYYGHYLLIPLEFSLTCRVNVFLYCSTKVLFIGSIPRSSLSNNGHTQSVEMSITCIRCSKFAEMSCRLPSENTRPRCTSWASKVAWNHSWEHVSFEVSVSWDPKPEFPPLDALRIVVLLRSSLTGVNSVWRTAQRSAFLRNLWTLDSQDGLSDRRTTTCVWITWLCLGDKQDQNYL